jgi:asparagine synthase (glutamine-hydrolysing)
MSQVARQATAPRAASAARWVALYATGDARGSAARDWIEGPSGSSAHGANVDVFVAGTLFEPATTGPDGYAALAQPRKEATPAEILLAQYLAHGDALLNRLRGHFALVIVDRERRRLLAVRDPMGQHPLFYTRTSQGVLLSPVIDALLEQPGVSNDLDRLVLAEHLQHRWVDPNETFFAAVRRVPPGHVLEVSGDRLSVRRYWDPASASREQVSDADAIERFDEVFERAVARAVGNGRAGIFLSGGFDSVSIAATATTLARRNGTPQPHALSLGFVDPECDEQFVQRSVAHALGLSQDLLPLDSTGGGGRGILLSALELGASWPAPLLNLWAPAYQELASLGRRHGCTTILTGTGGDEWLNVTPCLSADLIRRGQLLQLARFVGVFQRSFRMSKVEVLRGALWTFGVRRLIGSAAAALAPGAWESSRHRREIAKTHPWVAPDAQLRRQMDDRAMRVLPPARPGPGGFYDRELQVALTHPLVAMEYEEHFEFGQRVGATMAHPYLDADLVQLLYGVSPLALTSGGRTKGLVRDAVARRFPDLGFEGHKKVNANSFYRNVLEREGPLAWEKADDVRALADLGLIEPRVFGSVIADLFAGRRPHDNYLVWNVLNLNAWVRARLGQS